jgi:hypothetical protein
VAYFNHLIPKALPLILIGFIATNTSVIIIHTKMERLSGLQNLAVRHRSPLAAAARDALRTSLVGLHGFFVNASWSFGWSSYYICVTN